MTISRTIQPTSSTTLVNRNLSAQNQTLNLLSILPFSSDLCLLILSLCGDSLIQSHVDCDALVHSHAYSAFLKLKNTAEERRQLFHKYVLTAEQDDNLEFKAVTLLRQHPDLASLHMPFAQNYYFTNVWMTILQKLIYSLDSRFRRAVEKVIRETGSLCIDEIRQQIQYHVDEAQLGNRHEYVNMSAWKAAYEYPNRDHVRGFKKSNILPMIGNAQKEMWKQAPNIFPYEFCAPRPLNPIPDYATELRNKRPVKRSLETEGWSGQLFNLKDDHALGERFFVVRGSQHHAFVTHRDEWEYWHKRPARDAAAIAAYVKEEIVLLHEFFRKYNIRYAYPVEFVEQAVVEHGQDKACCVML